MENKETAWQRSDDLDFHRANLPNFAAELGNGLGVNSKTRKMMREFFEANRDNSTRRSFWTSSRLTMEGGHMEQTSVTNSLVEPIFGHGAYIWVWKTIGESYDNRDR